MKRSEATLSEQGRVTLPAAVRAALKAKPGDRLVFDQDATGDVHIRVKVDPTADHVVRSGDLRRLPTLVAAARSRSSDPKPDDPIGDFLIAEDERTKSRR